MSRFQRKSNTYISYVYEGVCALMCSTLFSLIIHFFYWIYIKHMSWWQFHFTIINRNYVVQLYATSKSDSYPHSLIIFFNSKFILKCIYVALLSVHNYCKMRFAQEKSRKTKFFLISFVYLNTFRSQGYTFTITSVRSLENILEGTKKTKTK